MNLIAQSVNFLYQTIGVGSAAVNSYDAVMKFAQESNQL